MRTETISCYKCGVEIMDLKPGEYAPDKYKGLNHGIGGKAEYECSFCGDRRRQAYDDYVDPTGFYQNKNFDYD